MFECYQDHCEKLQRTGNYRQLPVWRDDAACFVDFSSNDYLGLSQNKLVFEAGLAAAARAGCGATGSRLLSGNRDIFTEFEQVIARDKNMQAALLFNSGFQANATVLASLLNTQVLPAKPLVFFDRLNHASLYQAVFLSQAKLIRYRHLDYEHLASCLETYRDADVPKFVVTETLFGMDGDVVCLEKIMALAREHQAFVYLDEAHALGLLGPSGYGLSTTIDENVPTLVMGTLSKAVGVAGAYIASSAAVIDFIINTAPGFIFSTAQSPFVIGAALKAWQLIPTLAAERQQLHDLSIEVRAGLVKRQFDIGRSSTHIIPIMMKNVERAAQLQQQLMQRGIFLSLIRRPTVPPGGERLRLTLNVTHTNDAIQYFFDSLDACL